MKRLHFYIAGSVMAAALVALVVVLSLMMVFEFIDEATDAGSLSSALIAVLLSTPQRAYEIFPITTLIGALVGLGALASRHELVAMRAAGMSVLSMAGGVLAAGVVLAWAALMLGEWVAPPAERLAQQWRAQAQGGAVTSGIGGGFWVRDGTRFVHVERAPQPDLIEGVSVYTVREHRLKAVTRAARGRWDEGAWVLEDVERSRPSAEAISRSTRPSWRMPSEITPATLEVVVRSPETLKIGDLYTYIQYLKDNGLDSAEYRLAFWIKIATPVATLTMLVMTIPLIFGGLAGVGTGQQIFVGVLIGIAFFLANRLLASAGLVYGLPPALSALAPTAVFLGLGLWGLLRVR